MTDFTHLEHVIYTRRPAGDRKAKEFRAVYIRSQIVGTSQRLMYVINLTDEPRRTIQVAPYSIRKADNRGQT